MIDWTNLSISTVFIVTIAWFAKVVFSQIFSKDLEKFKSNLNATSEKSIEEFRSNIQLEAQKKVIEYTSLHDKQTQIIADFYAKLSVLYGSIEHLMAHYRVREIREDIEKEHPPIPQSKRIGLTVAEQQAVDAVKVCNKELFGFYRKNKIYFSLAVCQLFDSFNWCASYLEMHYLSVTFKDGDGTLYVNAKVKEVWDQAVKTIPKLLNQLEKEFRDILGVKS